jgi:hypothetical protein
LLKDLNIRKHSADTEITADSNTTDLVVAS